MLVGGDFNCPGSSNDRVSDRLEDVLISADLEQHVHEPTREHNLLDILATSDPDLVSSIHIVDSRSVSDHKLVIASLDMNPAKPEVIRQTFRNLRNFNASEFESALQRSILFTDPASTVEEFSSQLQEIVTVGLNKVCPLKTRTCRPSNSTSVLGPILFTSFISPIQFVISQFKVDQQQYADDTQVFISSSKSNSPDRVSRLETALVHLTSWFFHNGLALNPEKSEAILLGTHPRNNSIQFNSDICTRQLMSITLARTAKKKSYRQ